MAHDEKAIRSIPASWLAVKTLAGQNGNCGGRGLIILIYVDQPRSRWVDRRSAMPQRNVLLAALGIYDANECAFRTLTGGPSEKTDLRTVWLDAGSLITTIGIKPSMRVRIMRKLIAFDEDTFDKLKQLGRDRMATFQELADEAFADLLRKHGIPIDLKDALRKSARLAAEPARRRDRPKPSRKTET